MVLFVFSYNVAFLIITYLLPIVAMTFAYARIGCELWGSQSIGECTQRQMENIKSKRRVSSNHVIVIFYFIYVCNAPTLWELLKEMRDSLFYNTTRLFSSPVIVCLEIYEEEYKNLRRIPRKVANKITTTR